MKGKSDAEGISIEIGGFYYEQDMADHRCKQRIRKRDDKAALRERRHRHRYREKYKQDITISSQSGWRMPQLSPEEDRQLAMTPTEELLDLDILKRENIKDTLHAYQMAKRCNEKHVMYECTRWAERGARLNDIAPGIIVTPLAIDEFNGPRGDFYKNMFAKCPAGRPGTADEMATIAEFLLSDAASFVTGSTFLADGGATASYYYGSLQPEK